MYNNKSNEMLKLVNQLNHYRDEYYNNNNSEISDEEYDKLFDQLQQYEQISGTVYANSPTQTVGYTLQSELVKTKHSHPMLSLDKTKDSADLVKFAGNRACLISLKMDGLTVCLTYDNGELVKAETRGDGETGEDITENAKMFTNVPIKIDYKGHLEVEGEAIVTYEDFKQINSNLSEEEKFKHPRNYASGSIRQLNTKITKDRKIKFVAWKVPGEFDIQQSNSMLGRFNEIKSMGFTIVPLIAFFPKRDANNIEEIIEASKKAAKYLDYPIDGLVICYDDIAYAKSLGQTGHHPKHSLAFKFYDEGVETILRAVTWTMGKTGTLTPTAIFDPVEIDSTTVSKASLHNLSIMDKLDLRMDDEIKVIKANQIIPQVTENLSIYKTNRGEKFIAPTLCPYCGDNTVTLRENDSDVVSCINPNCDGKKLFKLVQFCSKEGLNIRGLSEATMDKLMPKYLYTPLDIFYLNNYEQQLINIDGLGRKWFKNLMTAIETAKNTDLQHFLVSLSIPMVGTETAKLISKECKGNVDNFIDHISNNVRFESVGSVVNKNLTVWFSTGDNAKLFDQVLEFLTLKVENNNSNDKLDGLTFCITGLLNVYPNRNALVQEIENYGGKVSGSVSKKTSYLINNDTESNSSKNQKAKEYGIPIISESEFKNLLEGEITQ